MRPGFTASDELSALLQRALDALQENSAAAAALESAPAAVRESLPLVFAASDFIGQSCARDAKLLPALVERGDLQRTLTAVDFATRAPTFAAATNEPGASTRLIPETDALADLRRWRRHEMVRIAWRDLAGWAALPETLSDLSAFADAAINLAVQYARGGLVARYGEPRSAAGAVQPLVVLAMGKLGGGELNFSSDVDRSEEHTSELQSLV